ncbi:aldolase-type TIM barrel [Lipomyces oligophaga]|uniref:aldolase-type TIM barrel n=1 Tax=Lipomyces oligophaga TaxID=45792 RepID=UPI0034CF6A2F
MSSRPVRTLLRAASHRALLKEKFPWTLSPLVVGAPMRVFSGPELAISIYRAGGLGFIGPGIKAANIIIDLEEVQSQLLKENSPNSKSAELLPVGVGFQVWNGDLEKAVIAVSKYRPCAVWLFAPRSGQSDLVSWIIRLREASFNTSIWVQVGTLKEALDVASNTVAPPDVLVIQGAEAGGHGRASDGIGLITLLPEISDALESIEINNAAKSIPLIGAGGIADGRGAVAALGLGASGVALGTRFLASTEARINESYQTEIIRATDGASTTGRTQLYNHLRGTFGWPEEFSPRGLLNQSWTDYKAGVPFDELKKLHDEAVKEGGNSAWGPNGRTATYASASVGLIREVQDAEIIVRKLREDIISITKSLEMSIN